MESGIGSFPLRLSPRGPAPQWTAQKADITFSDQWEHQRVVHNGAVSTVTLCRGPDGEALAVKAFASARLLPRHRLNLQREVAVLSRLRACGTPGVVHLLSTEKTPDSVLLVFRACGGGDLYRSLKQRTWDEAHLCQQVVAPLLRVLADLHAMGYVHRDIKPENIFFTDDGTLQLGDFGLTIDQRRERPISRVGTLDYMAPEVLCQPSAEAAAALHPCWLPSYDEKVDIWGVGVLVLEVLTGRAPFAHPHPKIAALKARFADPPPLPPGVSGACCDFVRRVLCRDPHQRPSAEQLLAHPWVCAAATAASTADDASAASSLSATMTTPDAASDRAAPPSSLLPLGSASIGDDPSAPSSARVTSDFCGSDGFRSSSVGSFSISLSLPHWRQRGPAPPPAMTWQPQPPLPVFVPVFAPRAAAARVCEKAEPQTLRLQPQPGALMPSSSPRSRDHSAGFGLRGAASPRSLAGVEAPRAAAQPPRRCKSVLSLHEHARLAAAPPPPASLGAHSLPPGAAAAGAAPAVLRPLPGILTQFSLPRHSSLPVTVGMAPTPHAGQPHSGAPLSGGAFSVPSPHVPQHTMRAWPSAASGAALIAQPSRPMPIPAADASAAAASRQTPGLLCTSSGGSLMFSTSGSATVPPLRQHRRPQLTVELPSFLSKSPSLEDLCPVVERYATEPPSPPRTAAIQTHSSSCFMAGFRSGIGGAVASADLGGTSESSGIIFDPSFTSYTPPLCSCEEDLVTQESGGRTETAVTTRSAAVQACCAVQQEPSPRRLRRPASPGAARLQAWVNSVLKRQPRAAEAAPVPV